MPTSRAASNEDDGPEDDGPEDDGPEGAFETEDVQGLGDTTAAAAAAKIDNPLQVGATTYHLVLGALLELGDGATLDQVTGHLLANFRHVRVRMHLEHYAIIRSDVADALVQMAEGGLLRFSLLQQGAGADGGGGGGLQESAKEARKAALRAALEAHDAYNHRLQKERRAAAEAEAAVAAAAKAAEAAAAEAEAVAAEAEAGDEAEEEEAAAAAATGTGGGDAGGGGAVGAGGAAGGVGGGSDQ